ncbi:MAG: D-2-hydroxyacid dehydrogenase [Stomatobaculum sp.]|jgi:glycerate dehydrogenase|nr:D-2-hydroxyacid dehydrogenase [Stomatobaculum sp.]MBR7058503.1 D-2-hydroxyacid dehydrogenase [Stomatobaculum sp.]
MKIVVLDGYTENPGDISWAPLEALGEVTVYDRTAYEESPLIAERIGNAEIIVINKTPVSRATIDACPNLKAVAVLATGYNVVDYEYAKEKGIPVMNVPVYGTDNVSQFAVSLLLEICSHIGHHSESVHKGEWASSIDWCYWHFPMIEVSGKTAGIIGLGKIGVNTAKILRAMNVKVLAYDAFQTEAGRAVADYVELDELLKRSDFVFLHCPLFPSTQGIINKENIARMKDGAILINNSRGPLVVEQDLADALNSGKLAAAAVDVVSTEPIKADNVLLTARNCIITPHISWATKEARERIMQTTADNIKAFMAGEPVNVVNR